MAFSFQPIGISCQLDGNGASIEFSLITDALSGTTYTVLLADAGVTVRSTALGSVLSGSFEDVPDGTYQLIAIESTGQSLAQSLFVECGGYTLGGLFLGLSQIVAPTSAGGQGYIEVVTSTAALNVTLDVRGTTFPFASVLSETFVVNGAVVSRRLLGITDGQYQVRAVDQAGVTAAFAFVMPDYVEPPAPPISGPPTFYAVGGVLPNPVPCPLSVAAAPGRWVEVQVLRESQLLGSGRMTVRVDNPVFDAAPYLRAHLSTTPATGANVAADLDPAACVEFWYQYRIHEADGTVGAWVEEQSMQRFAVLAALPGLDDPLTPWVASAELTGRFTTVFPEAVQFVGLPLTVGLLVPPDLPDDDVYVEFLYLDGAGQQIEIRAVQLDKPAPGYYRFLLPSNPLPCAERVLVTLVNEDRSYEGVCVGGGTSPEVPGGYIIANGGYLKV